MEYTRLTDAYWKNQIGRIEGSRQTIVARDEAASVGRVIPGEETLAIGTGRRIDIAVMFIDICGFSSRSSNTLAEQDLLLRSLNLFFTEMTRIAEDYGGTLEKNTGDGLMAYFLNDAGGTSAGRRPLPPR